MGERWGSRSKGERWGSRRKSRMTTSGDSRRGREVRME